MTDNYQPPQATFDKDVSTGRMKILRDDGLYRHHATLATQEGKL